MTILPLPFFLFLLPISVISHLHYQRSTLLSIKHQWGDLPALSSWNPATSPCSWAGIQCSSSSSNATNSARAVTGISLFNANISSEIPPSICDVETLENLDLSWNNIPGGFPTALYGCSALTHLNLYGNLFVGPIPDDVDKLSPSLQYLNVSTNNFTGDTIRQNKIYSYILHHCRYFELIYTLHHCHSFRVSKELIYTLHHYHSLQVSQK